MLPADLWKHGHSDQEIVDAMVQAKKDKVVWASLAARRRTLVLAARHHRKARPTINPTIRPNRKKARKRGR